MSALIHSLATLWSRFRWEILGYLLLVVLCLVPAPADAVWVRAVTSLGALALYWLTFRILLSEAGFSTHGGWRTRPFAPDTIFISQMLLIVAILLAGGIVKVVMLYHLFHPTADQWIALLKSIWLSAGVPWLAFVVAMKFFDFLFLRRTYGPPRKAVWAMMAVVLVPAFLIPASWVPRMTNAGGSRPNLSEGIRRLLPPDTDILGALSGGNMDQEIPQARLLCRFRLDGSSSAMPSGIALISLKATDASFNTHITLDLAAIDRADLVKISHAVPMLAYADGTHAKAIDYLTSLSGSGEVVSHLPRAICRISFSSPRALPENRQASPALFPPTELLFFVEDPDLPLIQLSPPPAPEYVGTARDVLPHLPASIPLEPAVRELIDSFNANSSNRVPSDVVFKDRLPREAMPHVLAYHPWTDLAWEKLIRPFLQQQATDADKPALLQRLSLDPRLTRFFIDRGWSPDAVPVLRERARQRLALDATSLMLLAGGGDPALNADLAALAIRLDTGVGQVAEKLRQDPSFAWPAFVAAGWKSRKYGSYEKEGWLYARWSAELGDFSGFRQLAEKAAAERKWENEKLPALVAGEHGDLLGYLRENIDRMKFDPATKTWGM